METLKPGTALFTGPSGAVLRDAAGELFAVALSDEAVGGVRAALTRADAPVPPELSAFDRAGHLGRRASWPVDRRTVAVLAGPGAALVDALRLAGANPVVLPGETGLDELLERRPAAVCGWHDGPAPDRWLDLDPLAGHGIGWQRISREGRHVLLEPIGVSHRDVRARRLAAAGSGHRHLRAYWAGENAVLGDETPDPAELLLVAALAVKDLARWAADLPVTRNSLTPDAIPAHRRLRVLDLDTGALADHPVLPVPASAP
ncbi:hypothetical protein ABZ816_39685 [Actinosynnema sp. NPDC047251]|uniref:Uncharacterized protein n=1 Tax=Saccharothrix espanaensis (strain ATCC 51144 / DSM 44229 / JCM 9112 / NBRC 15066 / NRRL 15764) TaxID=1179773 RepID=K0K187_SACES|nr:hypothetical protein [Saccharothrix espanaensis]CCH30604.1 hypothetical protein BN6_33000 [Saccharothrix espanaensis DSM 44229]